MVGALVRELQLDRAVTKGQPVRLESHVVQPGPGEHGADVYVETVADHAGFNAARTQPGDQRREAGIDALAGDKLQKFPTPGAQEPELPPRAHAGGNLAAYPLLVDLAPGRIGKSVEDDVPHVVGRDSAVEIEGEGPLRIIAGQAALGGRFRAIR